MPEGPGRKLRFGWARSLLASTIALVSLVAFDPSPATANALEAQEETLQTPLAELSWLAQLTSARTGFSTFDEANLEAVAETPRDQFLSAQFKNQPYANRAFRLG